MSDVLKQPKRTLTKKSSTSSVNIGHVEVSEEALRAWNHSVECATENCEFKLCKEIKPYVLHVKGIRAQGIVGMCLESCKFCVFHDNLNSRVIKPELKGRRRKVDLKKQKLVQQLAGLLLMHTKQGNDPIFSSLYEHTMNCNINKCGFRLEYGSCVSSRKLLHHLVECKPEQTKTCELCSQLPPKLRRIKKQRRTLPLPLLVKAEIEEKRKARQKEKRRERNALKKYSSSLTSIDADSENVLKRKMSTNEEEEFTKKIRH